MRTRRHVAMLLVAGMALSACQSTVRNGQEIAVDDLPSSFPTSGDTSANAITPIADMPSGGPSDTAAVGSGTTTSTSTSTSTGATSTTDTSTGGTSPTSNTSGAGTGPSTVTTGGAGTSDTAATADPGTSGPAPTAAPAAPAAPPATTIDPREMGPGITADTITLGVHLTTELTAAFAAVGAEQSSATTDERLIAQTFIDHLNAEGGIAGRQIVPVFHETNPADGTFASQAQAACATFTEDNQVFAVLSSSVGGSDAMLACLAPKSTPLVEGNFWVFDETYFRENRGLLYQPGRMMADRWVRAYVDGLERAGYLAEGRQGLGLLRFDHPVFVRMADNVLKPRLAELGYELTDEVEIQSPRGLSDFGSMAAELNSAVTRFRLSGVTHVMMLENAGIMPFFLFDQAESQGYRPRYALSSSDVPATQARQGDPNQLQGSVAIGWMTSAADQYGEDVQSQSALADRCEAIMEAAGLTGGGFYDLPRCDALHLLRAALDRAPALTASGLLAGVEALGESYGGAIAGEGRTRFGPGRYDGPDVVRQLDYDLACECYVYNGPFVPVS